jgi:hypothetical protein
VTAHRGPTIVALQKVEGAAAFLLSNAATDKVGDPAPLSTYLASPRSSRQISDAASLVKALSMTRQAARRLQFKVSKDIAFSLPRFSAAYRVNAVRTASPDLFAALASRSPASREAPLSRAFPIINESW